MNELMNQVIKELKRIGAYSETYGNRDGVCVGIKGDTILIQDETVSITGDIQQVLDILKNVESNSGYEWFWQELEHITKEVSQDEIEDFIYID